MITTKRYIVHIYGGVEASLIPVKKSVKATLLDLKPGEEDSVHLLEIDKKGNPTISDFSGGYMEQIRDSI